MTTWQSNEVPPAGPALGPARLRGKTNRTPIRYPPQTGFTRLFRVAEARRNRSLPGFGGKIRLWDRFASPRRMSVKMPRSLWRLAVSVGLIVSMLAVCLRLRHVDHATVALLMVLAIVGLAKTWGWAEALTATIVGGIGFEYYVLSPRGLGVGNPEHWIALAAFLVTAVATGQLAAQLRRRRIEAVERQVDMEKLYRLVNALMESGSAESTTLQLADKLVEILDAEGVAVYDKHSGSIVRSGPRAVAISDQALRDMAIAGRRTEGAESEHSFAPIRYAGEVVGCIGVTGAKLSDALLGEVAGRVGLGLARLYALEKTTQAAVIQRSEQLKSAVLDAMAHEIRGPLNSIRIAATTLLSGNAGQDVKMREMLTIIDQEVTRTDSVIDETVQLARLEANQLSLKKEPQQIGQLILTVIQDMGALAGGRSLHVCVPDFLPAADCDKEMIARVLRQILSNALKYSPDHSPLTISAELSGDAIVIDVVDRGPGVDEKEKDRIFEKYFRGRAARAGTSGTGLGLASARSIVRAHGGEIWVTSPPAGGAAFHVSLPLAGAGRPVGVL